MNSLLICYDIHDARRCARLHRRLQKRAQMLQYSVYWAEDRGNCLDELQQLVDAYVDPRCDDVRIYHVENPLLAWQRGRPVLPEGLLAFGPSG